MKPVGILLLVAAVLAILAVPGAAMTESTIRIGIFLGQQQVRVAAAGGFTAINLATGQVIDTWSPGASLIIVPQDQGIRFGEAGVFTGPVQVVTAAAGDNLTINGSPYRGTVEIRLQQGALTVINELPVEEYLYGVVPREMPADFPLEALKAQAVVARTYTYANRNRHQAEGFNLCATIHCQVYGGAGGENPATTRAVEETRGQVLRHEGRLIEAYYHSSSGGYTENSENVWSAALPYIRGVPDFDHDSPYANWTLTYTPEELGEIFQENGLEIGNLEGIEPLSYGVSGRVSQVRIRGSRGSVDLSGNELRRILGYNELRSTLFEVEYQGQGEGGKGLSTFRPGQQVTIMGGDGGTRRAAVEEIKVLGAAGGSGAQGFTALGSALDDTGSTGGVEQVVFRGSGWGHGLGMSQWGARAMALQAPPGAVDYYRTILQHYYQGCMVEEY